MPFASDKQRRYLWSQKPEVAKQIAYKQEGGLLDGLQRPEINNLEDLQRVANARNQELAAVAAELGISPQDLANVQGSSADQANDIARQIWGDNAPQLRQSSGAAETAGEMAGVLAELAKQNPGAWGNQAANQNALQPAKQQGFFSWAADQAGDAWDSAGDATGSAFQQAIDYATGETARQRESAQHQQALDDMTPEQLVEYLDNKYGTSPAVNQASVPATNAPPPPPGSATIPEGTPIDPETGQPRERTWTEKALDAAKSLNPIGSANAMDARSAIGLAGIIPNPTLANAPVFQGGLNVGGAMGNFGNSGGGGTTSSGGTREEPFQAWSGHDQDKQYDAWQHSQAYGAKPATQRWEKGWFSDGFVDTTPEEQAREQQYIDQQQFHADRFFLDRDNQGYGAGQVDPMLAEATRAQGDFNTTGGWNDGQSSNWRNETYEDNSGGGHPSAGVSYGGFDDGEDDSDWDDDFGWDGGSDYEDDVESDVGTNTYASPYEQGQQDSGGGGGDDSGGGGK